MSGPTPDEMRKMQEAYESVGKYWYADLATKELRRRQPTGATKYVDLFWRKRHTVWQFYWWLARRRAQEDMIPLDNPIQSDNMPIRGFPMKYELQGGWTIPRDDLKYLMKGPLASQGLSEVLVPAALGWQRVWLFLRQFGVILGTLITLVGATIRWWPELLQLWKLAF